MAAPVPGRKTEGAPRYGTDRLELCCLLRICLRLPLTASVLIAIPGPSVLFTVSRAIALGRAAGVATVAGNTVGAFAQVVAVAFGIGPLVERSVAVFTVLKLAGACYLMFLGVQAIRHRPA